MESPVEYASAEERERLIFRFLLVNKWFLIPTSVAYEWILSASVYRARIYNLSVTLPTIVYTSVSLVLIVLLWFAHRRLEEKEERKSPPIGTTLISLVSYAVDMFYVFFLIVIPDAGNQLWFLFLPPLSLALLTPRAKKFANWIVDGAAATVLLISIYGLLLSYDSVDSINYMRYNPADYLLSLSGLLFMWVAIRMARGWIDDMNSNAERLSEANALWREIAQRFPAEFFLVNEQGELRAASKEARKLLSLPKPGDRDWPECAQSIRNALLLRFHAETKMEETITIPDDDFPHPIKIYPTFFSHKGMRYCIALAQEQNPNVPQRGAILRSDRLSIAGQIAAGLAHEIGNPLGVIRSCADYLRQKCAIDDPYRKEIDLIDEEAKKCQNLIDRLLSLASPKRDAPAVRDLREILERSISLVKYQAGKKIVESTLPPEPAYIYANEGQMLAVFVNLLLNALQSMEKSPPGAKLRVHMRRRGKEAIVDVTDEGSGIAKDELEKIFDPFFTKRAEGTGLGLSIVHQIVTSMNGRIDVASTLGAGTTFTVSLPLHEMGEE
ncbi:MAG: ATP-binding protein [Candidatus Omnitrophota bacterium]